MKTYELCTKLENYSEIHEYIERLLGLTDINETGRYETLLIFEALYNDMIAKGIPGDTRVTVGMTGYFGRVNIRMRFNGKLYVPMSGGEDHISVEQRIMYAYGDRIENRYHAGCNYMTITVRRSARMAARTLWITTALAVAAFFLITSIFDSSRQIEMIREGAF